MREQDKHFLSSLYFALAIILTWKGLWEGLTEIPIIGNPFVALFIGFALLTFTGLIFKEFDPFGGLEKGITKELNYLLKHPENVKFQVYYKDNLLNQERAIPISLIREVDDNIIVVEDSKKKEYFIPTHRVTRVDYNGQKYWRF
jgi:uncharacterized protein (UPF0248 family)